MKQLPEAVGGAAKVLTEGAMVAGGDLQLCCKFVELGDLVELGEVGTEGIGKHEGIPAVVLGAGRGVPVAEAVELLGVQREDGKASLKQSIDERMEWRLDGHASETGVAGLVTEMVRKRA